MGFKIKFELKIIAIYLVLGFLWIEFSDKIALIISKNFNEIIQIQTYKGWFYVIITATAFYFILAKHLNKLRKTEHELENHKQDLKRIIDQKTKKLDENVKELQQKNAMLNENNQLIKYQNEELKNAMNHLHQAQNNLIKAEKEASINVLMRGLAHELNNPLNYIQGSYTGLQSYFDKQSITDNESRFLLESIKTGVERSVKIISNLNYLNHSFNHHDEIIDINRLFSEIKETFKCTFSTDFNLEIANSNSVITLKCESQKIKTALINILENACRSIQKGGQIDVKVHQRNQFVEIIVEDNGCGIEAQNISKIIDPFFSTRDAGQGIGLGLTISNAIIEQHNGSLKIESELNKGTKVKIILPIINYESN